jgi:uncharacterized protein YcfL
MRTLAVIALLALAGCRTAKPIQPPKVVEVVVQKIVPVPAALAEPCQQPAKRSNTVEEAVRLANVRKAALDECSARMEKIRGLR